jgi:hypothetical protein
VSDDELTALWRAMFAYYGDEGLDTLDRVEKPAAALMTLLADEANRQRLLSELGCEVVEAFSRSLDEVRSAARRRHVARRDNDCNLPAAYSVLAEFWQSTHPDEEFTNVWGTVDGSLAPTSSAACDIYDWLRDIDPHRPRLAEELRYLMGRTVENLPGPRQGRKT